MALRGLAKHLREPYHRHRARPEDVGEHTARPDRGKLVHIPDHHQRGARRHRLEEVSGQGHVDHAGLVNHEDIALQRLASGSLEAGLVGVVLKKSVNGLGLPPGRLGQTA
ncbi:hypothetical protein RZS08_05140, partial [Arthrospira platensis SPKY1]|nr:hypothetical protein [Arthrospira platensis SPKY1]